MSTKHRQPAAKPREPGYPSLKAHLASRRQFLGVAGACVAAGSLAACDRSLGGEHEPDGSVEILGIGPEPHFFTIRIPAEGDLSAYLIDDGYATFWVLANTYEEASYQALFDHPDQAQAAVRAAVADFTFDQLSTDQGVAAAEDDVLDALDTLCQELNQHSLYTMEAVTLTITSLSPYTHLMGDMPEPSYP